jgi:hypothetical protein
MSDVIELDSKRPHLAGEALCVGCKHEWAAVVQDIGVIPELECPKCSLMTGYFKDVFQPECERWVCDCGGDLFFIIPIGKQCARCSKATAI